MKLIHGFSKLSHAEKLRMAEEWVTDIEHFRSDLADLRLTAPKMNHDLELISENAIALYPLPFSIAPNFLINGTILHFPMVTEESSVVAAASSAAKFWAERGGFKLKVNGTLKTGQLHFTWKGKSDELFSLFEDLKAYLMKNLHPLTARMEKRGGGITNIEILNKTALMKDYYELRISFETGDSMGANFINTCMEEAGKLTGHFLADSFPGRGNDFEQIMAILSNYTPDCLVEAQVECHPDDLDEAANGMTGQAFAIKFSRAVDIALIDPYRAVTHNKGILNGIDAFLIATGNDFRAVEANSHAYASRDGQYRGLSYVIHDAERFVFGVRIPMSVGTTGGLTKLHPLAKWSFDLLGSPSAPELMMMAAAAGLATHFSSLRALITSGIQTGHMKMHLNNILSSMNATDNEKNAAHEHFRGMTVSYSNVKKFLENKRSGL